MLLQVRKHESPSRHQDPRHLLDSYLRTLTMMQHHIANHGVYRRIRQRDLFHVSNLELDIPSAKFGPCLTQHCLREIESYHLSSNLGRTFCQESSPCAHIQHGVLRQESGCREYCVSNLVAVEALSENVPGSRDFFKILLRPSGHTASPDSVLESG